MNDIIKPACDKFTKQYKSTFKKEFEPENKNKNEKISDDPLVNKVPKDIQSLFKLMRNLINGTLISAKIILKKDENDLTLEDYTVHALMYIVEQ